MAFRGINHHLQDQSVFTKTGKVPQQHESSSMMPSSKEKRLWYKFVFGRITSHRSRKKSLTVGGCQRLHTGIYLTNDYLLVRHDQAVSWDVLFPEVKRYWKSDVFTAE
jgi:hypothetical protein